MTDAAGSTVVTGDGRRVRLGKLIKSGGAGSVYHLQEGNGQVAKLYHPSAEHAMYVRKIAAMLELTPDLPDLVAGTDRYVQLAWPQAAIYDGGKRFLGYLMPAVDVDSTSELECILQERQARSMGLATGLGAKVTLAANLCAVIAALHRQRHFVVDLKPVNLRFYRRSLYMAMLDCDGFSIQGHGERFAAPQITPDYLAPEFHARALTDAGENMQDRFALAVVVFQLLNFGIHPFTGRPQNDRVPTDIPGRIAGRWYAYGIKANASLLPSPTSGHAAMPAELRQMFDRAFESAGGTRPAADEWSTLLRGYAQRAAGKLIECARDKAHQHFLGLACAACARHDLLAGAKAAARAKPARAPTIARPVTLASRMARAAQRPAPRTGAATGAIAGPRPPAPPRPLPRVLGQAQRRWAAAAANATATATLARIRAASAKTAAGSNPQPPWMGGSFFQWFFSTLFASGFMGQALRVLLVVIVALGVSGIRKWNDSANADFRAEHASAGQVRIPASVPPPTPVVAPVSTAPRIADYRFAEFRDAIDALPQDVLSRNDYAIGRGLPRLHAEARARDAQWRNAIASGQRGGDPDAVLLAGHQARRDGWAALEQGLPAVAQRRFTEALWADPVDAEAWFGYGASRESAELQGGAMAIALLHATDPVERSQWRVQASGLMEAQGTQVDRIFENAAAMAEALRTRLPPGAVPVTAPIRWEDL